ncbi:MAG: TIGR04338 family metallohydrolase, partial [Candidatus Nanopelagicales bacterium]|nr:TIGR04338 family metallohydrolase [Candidatus Nanopelagicales bacterium]
YPRAVDAPSPRERDSLRSAIYEAEDRWSALLDHGGVLDFFGSRLTLPVQRRFGSVETMQMYADWVLAHPDVVAAYGAQPGVTVRARAGQARAHYEPQTATIAIPMDARWAAREAVVLHELAHHVAVHDTDAWHSTSYAAAMLVMTHAVLGPEATLVLRAGYEDAGISVAP